MLTKLFIENQEIELKDEVQFLLNKQFEDITNPTVIINEWSKTVEIPSTQYNDEVFGHIYSPDKIIVEESVPSILIKTEANKLTTSYYSPASFRYDTTFDVTVNYAHITMTPTPNVGSGSLTQFAVYVGELGSSAPYDELTHQRLIGNVSSGVQRLTFTATEHNNAIKISASGGADYYPSFVIANGINHDMFTPGVEYTFIIDFTTAQWGNVSDINLDFNVSLAAKVFDYKHFGVYFDPYRKLDFRLEWNDFTVMEGYAKLNEIKRTGSKTVYSMTLNGTLGKVFQELKKITFDKALLNSEDAKYVIPGWEYYKERINRQLVLSSWENIPRNYLDIASAIGHPEQFVGFLPNNAFSEDFDYKSYIGPDKANHKFEDALPSTFTQSTGIQPSTIIPDGLKPRDIGEFRSYNQLPFYWWDMFWQIFQARAEIITGYTWDCNDDWFTVNNPYWRNWIIKVRDFPVVPQEERQSFTNIYNVNNITCRTYPSILFWGGYYQTTTNNDWTNPIQCSFYMRDVNIEKPVYAVGTTAYNSYYQFLEDCDIINIPSTAFCLSTESRAPISISNNIYWKHYRLKINYQFLDIDTNTVVLEQHFYVYSNADKQNPDNYFDIIINSQGQKTSSIWYWTINIPNYKIDRQTLNLTSDRFRINMVLSWEPLTGADENPFIVNSSTLYDYAMEIKLPYQIDLGSQQSVNIETYKQYRSYSKFDYNDLWDNDHSPFEFILNYCKMFRIGIRIDEKQKKVIFKPIHKYLNDGDNSLDWSDKVDYSKDFVVKPISWENKYIKFNYDGFDTRSNSKYNKQFGFNYGEKQIITSYNFNEEDKALFDNIKIGITYTPTVVSWNNLYDEKIIFTIPSEGYLENFEDEGNKQIYMFGLTGFVSEIGVFDESSSLRPVIITDDSLTETQNDVYCFNQSGNSLQATVYPLYSNYTEYYSLPIVLYSTFNTPLKTYTTVNPLPGKQSYDIYTLFWQRYIEERYNRNNKVVTCYVNITPEEYQKFEFNKFVNIDNQLYFVNRIFDFNLTSNEPTKVELITIQDPSAYRTNIYNEILN